MWCAAAGGLLTHHRVIDAVKTSGLAERVSHRRLILPSLSAPGVEVDAIREATGFRAGAALLPRAILREQRWNRLASLALGT